jgi:large subunit ribosomal protein L4
MTSSPLWRGGGRIFPNSPNENFTQKVNKKMYRAGLASIFSQLAREDRLVVVSDFTVDAPKTRLVAGKLKDFGFSDSVLVITDAPDENLTLAARNLPGVMVLEAHQIDPVSLVKFSQVVLTKAAVVEIEEMLG